MSSNPDDLQGRESWLGATDLWLLAKGKHQRPWKKLGARPLGCEAPGFALGPCHDQANLVVLSLPPLGVLWPEPEAP